MSILRGLLGVLAALCVGAFLWVYSGTFTSQGRLDFRVAAMNKLAVLFPSPELVLSVDTIAQVRGAANEHMRGLIRRGEFPPMEELRDLSFPGPGGDVRVRYYRPSRALGLPVLLWFHGGGFFMGDALEIWDHQVARLAAGAQVAIFSVNYRLAPEHPWPAAVEDCYAALLWAYNEAGAFELDRSRIGVSGVSAGANLAAVVALRARDEAGPEIALQQLLVPVVDFRDSDAYESRRGFEEDLTISSTSDAIVNAYLPETADRAHPYASPIGASDLFGLPRALIMTAQYDALRDEGEAYARRLRAAGVEAELIRYDGAIHGLMGSPESAEHAMEAQIAMLKRVLHRD